MSINSLGYKIGKSPIAQSFYIDEVQGIFATSIELYFKTAFTATADLQLPISLHLRPMVNGMPSDTEIIPGSTVYVNYNLVNTSEDGTASTKFTFEEPIFLTGLCDYAMMIYADTNEYEIWLAEIDATVVQSASARVNKDPNTGTVFYSQNGATFSPSQKQDLKFKINRAKFTSTTGTVKLKNASLPREALNNNPIRTFEGDSSVRVYSVNHGLQINDTVSIQGSTDVGGVLSTTLNGDHTITKIGAEGFEFKVNTPADSDEIGGGLNVLTTKNIPYSVVWPNMALLEPLGTSVQGYYKGTSGKSLAGAETPYTVDNDFNYININANNISFEKNYVIAADSIADAEISVGAATAEMEVTFATAGEYYSPVLDLQRTSLTLIDNVIDNQDSAATSGYNVPLDFIAETEPSGGSHPAKHITKVVTLGSSAVGLKILLAANRPKGTEFKVYYRTASETDLIISKNWTEVITSSNNPADASQNTFREYEYLVGGKGGTMEAFLSYQLKIVMRSTNSAKVPVIKDLRAIALSV